MTGQNKNFQNRQRTLKKYQFNIEDDQKGQNILCQSPFSYAKV
jgi:hypothetical protein